jgi:hypothetical protein
MEDEHAGRSHGHGHGPASASLNRTALAATWHSLTGCAIGEILGLVIATALDWRNLASIVVAVVLAFVFGYSLTLRPPLVRGGVSLRRAARVALAADTVSIAVMEVVDNGFVPARAGRRWKPACLGDFLFWWSLVVGLFIAFWAAFPAAGLRGGCRLERCRAEPGWVIRGHGCGHRRRRRLRSLRERLRRA